MSFLDVENVERWRRTLTNPGKIVELSVPDQHLPIASVTDTRPTTAAASPEPPTRKTAAPVEQRAEVRHVIESGQFEPLWIICVERGVGGQAMMRDMSVGGLGIVVHRGAWRLIAALREAEATQALVEISRIPHDRHRRARIAWACEDELSEFRVGLRLQAPLSSVSK